MKSNIAVIAAGLALAIEFADTAAADSKCSKLNILVTNEFRDPIKNANVEIKVVDFKYWDKEDNKWRNESTDNKRILHGQTGSWKKNLAYVGGETGVKIKVYYKYSQPGGGWSTDYTQLSNAFKCIDGDSVEIIVS